MIELGTSVLVAATVTSIHADGSFMLRLPDGQGLLTSAINVKEVEAKGNTLKVIDEDERTKTIHDGTKAGQDAVNAAQAQALVQPDPTEPGAKDGSDDNVGEHDGPILPAKDPDDGEKGAKDGHFRDHPATEGEPGEGKASKKGK